jgi:C1A family cysteine protease
MADPTPLPVPLKPRQIARFGWKPSLPDPRDFRWAAPAPAVALPPAFSLRPKAPTVYDQLQLGCCVGNSCCWTVRLEHRLNGLEEYDGSRLFVYLGARQMEGTVPIDAGATVRDAFKVMNRLGVPHESTWPYQPAAFARRPPPTAYADGIRHRVVQYMAVPQTEGGICSAVLAGHPVVFGFSVPTEFESPEVARTGIVPMPGPTTSFIGGHCMALVGWEKRGQWAGSPGGGVFVCANPWGPGWGDGGYCYLAFAQVLSPRLSGDFFCCQVCQ